MKVWVLEDRARFESIMTGFWGFWPKVPPATKALYVERLEAYALPDVQRAVKEVKARQEVDRVPGLQVILAAVGEAQRQSSWRQKGQAERTGGTFRTPEESDLAKLATACVEIRDAKGVSWRFLHLEDQVTGTHDFGLDSAATNTWIPWTALQHEQADRLRLEGLQVLYDRGTPSDERTVAKNDDLGLSGGGWDPGERAGPLGHDSGEW